MILTACLLGFFMVSGPLNGGFERGTFEGWEADPNWVVVDNSCGYYSGWQGKYWAWSGGKGEHAMGVLKSKPFTLDRDGVSLLISGWNSLEGTGKPRKWNYVSLNLFDGTELDRVYAPNTTAFVSAFLDGSGHRGQKVVVKAVDDADEKTYSMLCIDEVHTADMPAIEKVPMPVLAPFDSRKSLCLESGEYRLEFNRSNGSLTRLCQKSSKSELILEPRLGGSFQFALPIPGKEPWQTIEANWIYGTEQKLTSYKVDSDSVKLVWNGPLKNYLGESYDVSVIETIHLTANGVQFDLDIDNNTKLPVGEVYQPFIGGIWGLGQTRRQLRSTELIRPASATSFASSDVFRVFTNFNFLGDKAPEQFYAIPGDQALPWIGFSSSKIGQSVLIAAKPVVGQKLVARLQLVPSFAGTIREDGTWPRPSELHGIPAGLEVVFADVAGYPVGQKYHAATVFVSFVRGGSVELQKAYQRWVK